MSEATVWYFGDQLQKIDDIQARKFADPIEFWSADLVPLKKEYNECLKVLRDKNCSSEELEKQRESMKEAFRHFREGTLNFYKTLEQRMFEESREMIEWSREVDELLVELKSITNLRHQEAEMAIAKRNEMQICDKHAKTALSLQSQDAAREKIVSGEMEIETIQQSKDKLTLSRSEIKKQIRKLHSVMDSSLTDYENFTSS